MSEFYYWLVGLSGIFGGFASVSRGHFFNGERKFIIVCLCFGCLVTAIVYAFKYNQDFDTYLIFIGLWTIAFSIGQKICGKIMNYL